MTEKNVINEESYNTDLCNGCKAFVKLQEENEELKAQIEKMKCCANCKYWFDMDSTCEVDKKNLKKIESFMIDCNCDKWELAE